MVEIGRNIVERAFRPLTITRNNALLVGSVGGSRVWATIAMLLTTGKMNGVDPHGWSIQTPHRIAGSGPNSQPADLMPRGSSGTPLLRI